VFIVCGKFGSELNFEKVLLTSSMGLFGYPWVSHVPGKNESCHKCKWVMSHVWADFSVCALYVVNLVVGWLLRVSLVCSKCGNELTFEKIYLIRSFGLFHDVIPFSQLCAKKKKGITWWKNQKNMYTLHPTNQRVYFFHDVIPFSQLCKIKKKSITW